MTDRSDGPTGTGKPTRRVRTIRRALALGTIAGGALGTVAAADTGGLAAEEARWLHLAQATAEGEGEAAASGEGEGEGGEGGGEGEGEGEGRSVDPDVAFLRDLGFMEGHLRAGMRLYEVGDFDAAKTHMGHPIEEKYDAVAGTLADLGLDRLQGEITALAEATEAEAPQEDVAAQFETVYLTIEEARAAAPGGERARLLGLAELTRVAADEYSVAVEGGEVSNLHEYQDAWGFLRAVEAEAEGFAASDDAAVAGAGATVLEQVAAADAAFGDIQGDGAFNMDPSLLYGAAARMELAANGVD